MPETTTAPPTTDKQDARATADQMVGGEADYSPSEKAQLEVARANAELAAYKGDWTLPARHQIDKAQLDVLRATVAKGCSPAELAMFLEVSARYGLDPFLKEIYAAKFDGSSGGVTVFTGRDGLLKAARNSGRFVRLKSAVVRENDTYEVEFRLGDDAHSDGVEGLSRITRFRHSYASIGQAKRGPIIGAYALVWRAGDPEPWFAEASWDDYGANRQKDNSGKDTAWTVNSRKGFPEAMMRKVAESIALRMAFGIAGIVGAEEIGDTPERVQNLSDPGGAAGVTSKPLVVEYGEDDLGRELKQLVAAINELRPGSWRPAKVAMRINGQPGARVELRDTLRRALGSVGPKGQERLAGIPVAEVEPPDADVVPDGPRGGAQEPAAAASEPEAAEGTPAAAEGAAEPEGAREARSGDDAEPEDAVTVDGTAEELPAYDRAEHSALVDSIVELRGILEGMAGDEPTLEVEEARAEAQRELDEKLEALELVNKAAEAAGEERVEA